MLMKPINYLLLSSLLCLMSCEEDKLPDDVTPDGTDNYVGDVRSFSLGEETSRFTASTFKCSLSAADGTVFSRQGVHERSGDVSNITLDVGLRDGVYRLLYFEYSTNDNPSLLHFAERFPTSQYGLGCRISVSGGNVTVLDNYDDEIGLSGDGTKESPYIISSYESLIRLKDYVNADATNSKITPDTYFRQEQPIDMFQASCQCDMQYGWNPIGADTNTPFRGVYIGNEITGLYINRPSSAGIGLFGYVYKGTISGLTVANSDITGNFAVGRIVGAFISAGDDGGRTMSSMIGCGVKNSSVKGSDGSTGIGGIVGGLDMYTSTLISGCDSRGTTVKGCYNVGGLVGGAGLYSRADIQDCENASEVTGRFSGAGGIIGTADTLYVSACRNMAPIHGATDFKGAAGTSGIGVGGIAGGTGMSWISASTNTAPVNGQYGVGGIVGSTRIKGSDKDAYMFNSSVVRWCGNEGAVSGGSSVGGICGESQFGCYGVYNTGAVSGDDFVGGIAGNTSIAVAHNAVNSGKVMGSTHVSGIVGKTTWGSLALDHNYGDVTSGGRYTGGVLGLGGNNTMIHYCGNFASVKSTGDGPVGGVVGEIGDPREWTAAQIADCVIGSAEMVLAVAGPVIGVAGHLLEEVAGKVVTMIEITEFSLHMIVTGADTGMFGYTIDELINPETESEMELSVHSAIDSGCTAVADRINSMRGSYDSYSLNGFDRQALKGQYNANVNDIIGWYGQEGNDEEFNDAINEARVERMEQLEKQHQTSAIIHEVVAGVCIAVGTVAAIGATVASGGTAAAFILAGSVTAVAGGLNAITKGCGEFAENTVIISQCVNAGDVSCAADGAGGIIGKLQDNGVLRDCLNMGRCLSSNGRQIVSHQRPKARVTNCIGIGDGFGGINDGSISGSVMLTDKAVSSDAKGMDLEEDGYMPLSRTEIADKDLYVKTYTYYNSDMMKQSVSAGFDIGSPTSRWCMGGGSSGCPVPNFSEYRK